ncbi:MAG: fibronectin type III domain-containing protein [Candidatus Paceibacterota bacterium]
MYKYFALIAILIGITTTGIQITEAVSSTFEINLSVISTDIDPPSVPANVVATGVSTSQIDVTWDASTDNVGVTGYHLYRDDTLIATTTATLYNDIGLATSTSYAYSVSAFDAVGNESATSSIAVGVTLSLPAPPTVATTTGQTGANGPILEDHTPEFQEFTITPGQSDAEITWNTSLVTQTQIKWGKTTDYEIGSLSNPIFQTNHDAFLGSLEPNTRYYIEVYILDGVFGRTNVVQTSFTTAGLPDTTAPANVSSFTVTYEENANKVQLRWQNPTDKDFEAVRVLRSTLFYPGDLYDGEVVYEGSGSTFTDTRIEKGKTYYYTVFARDTNKNYSSGAIGSVYIPRDATDRGDTPRASTTPSHPIHTFPEVTLPDPAFEFLGLKDFIFIQEGKQRTVVGSTVSVNADQQLTIELPYEKVPEVLKTIAVTFVHPVDRRNTFTFLLRADKDKSVYTATIDALHTQGDYGLYISMLNFENKRLTTLEGTVSAEGSRIENIGFGELLIRISILLILLILILFILRHIFKEKEEHTNGLS